MAKKVFIANRAIAEVVNTSAVTVLTTVTQLSSNTRQLGSGIQIVADATNTGPVYIATRENLTADGSETDGFPLWGGDSLFVPVTQEVLVYAVSPSDSQTIHFMSF